LPNDDVDTPITSDVSQSSAAPGTDTADAGSTSVDNQQTSEPSGGTAAEAGSAQAGNPEAKDAGSFTDTETKAVNAEAADAQAGQYGPEQYKRLQAWATKLSQRNHEIQAEMERLKSQHQSSQETAKQPATEPWDPEDSRHQEFLKLVDKADYFDEMIRGEGDENLVKAIQQKQLRVIGNDGIELLQRWQRAVRLQERERRLNPAAFYRKLIRQEAQPVVRETLQTTNESYQRQVQAVDDVRQWMAQSDIATDENKKAVIAFMEKGMPFDIARTAVEREHYRKMVSAAKKATASADEKERLLQGNAAGVVSRNPNASKKVDVAKLRQEKGITDGRALIDELFDLDQKGML
jgi:hypothetical protein